MQIQKATNISETNLYVQGINDFISLALFCLFVINLYLPFLFMYLNHNCESRINITSSFNLSTQSGFIRLFDNRGIKEPEGGCVLNLYYRFLLQQGLESDEVYHL